MLGTLGDKVIAQLFFVGILSRVFPYGRSSSRLDCSHITCLYMLILLLATSDQQTPPTQLSRVAAISAWAHANPELTAAISAVLATFLTIILWPTVKTLSSRTWAFVLARLSRKAAEHTYLNAVIDQHRFLPILPTTLVPVTGGAQARELDDVYVALTTSGVGGQLSEISAEDAIRSNERLVFLGDPGSGKTTLLRYLALTLARARRGRTFTRDRRANAADELKVQQARRRVKEDYRLDPRPLPVFLYLNRMKGIADWPENRSLLDYLSDEWNSLDSSSGNVSTSILKRFRRGECIFLFDAFDELATDVARAKVANLIGAFCSQAPSGNRFIVSSRIVGYQGQLAGYGFQAVTIQKLSWNLISNLVKKWYDALDQPMLSERLLDSFKANPRLLDLAANPMLLSLIVLVQYVLPLIPDKRHVLYDECIKVLIERRYAPPAIQAFYNQTLPSDEATALLRLIALALHKRKLREIPRGRLELEMLPEIMLDMPLSAGAQLSPQSIVKNIEERSQLLVERGTDESGRPIMVFSHLTFQEYLAATSLYRGMSSRGKQGTIDDLLTLYGRDPEWWQEVAVLFAAQLESKDQMAFLNSLKSAGETA